MSYETTTTHDRDTELTWKIPQLLNERTGRYEADAPELAAVRVAGREVSEAEWYRTLHPGEFERLQTEAEGQIDWDAAGVVQP